MNALLKGSRAGPQLWNHSVPHRTLANQALNILEPHERKHLPFCVPYAAGFRQVKQPVGFDGRCQRRCQIIRVDVEIFAAGAESQACHHRYEALGECQVENGSVDLCRTTNITQILFCAVGYRGQSAGRYQLTVAAADSHCGLTLRFQFCHPLLVDDSSQHHQGNVARGRVGHTQAVMKYRLNSQALERTGERLAAPVHHHHAMAGSRQTSNLARQVLAPKLFFRRLPSDFDDNFQTSAVPSAKPHMMFMFWMACPAAPLMRLSRADTMIMRVPSASSEKPMSV